MDIEAIFLENYKPFKEQLRVELRPLTIVIGKNSAGKSAFARVPLLLGHALTERAEAPLDLSFDGLDYAGSFRDFVHNRLPHGSVGLGGKFLAPDGTAVEVWAKVQLIEEYSLQIVSEFFLSGLEGFTVELKWLADDPRNPRRKYACKGTYAGEATASFVGILPDHVELTRSSPPFESKIQACCASLRKPARSMMHLGPFRQPPQRTYAFPGAMPRGVGMVTGDRAPSVLGADYKLKQGILSAVGEWFREYLGGWELDIDESGAAFSIVLKRRSEGTDLKVNLTEVGQGMSQVLPLVVQRKYAELTQPAGSFEVIEQPELHLHPAVHGAVADLYVSAVQNTRSRFIVETHAELFCLRVRHRVADGTLKPENVIIYCVEEDDLGNAQIKRINILDDGEVDYWPEGVFSEDFEEVRKIREAQRQKGVNE